jgi:hypothetical protein
MASGEIFVYVAKQEETVVMPNRWRSELRPEGSRRDRGVGGGLPAEYAQFSRSDGWQGTDGVLKSGK